MKNFRTEFQKFSDWASSVDGHQFQSFSKGHAFKMEGYKDELYAIARRRLAPSEWDADSIGNGDILNSVIHAIEISASDEGVGNNLLKWQQYGAHNILKEIKGDKRCLELEALLFDFYTDELDGEDALEPLTEIIGGKYPLVAYLFFIKDCDRYLPISPQNFDHAFQLLGSSLKTDRRCSWDNYSQYLELIASVRDLLRDVGFINTRLLDAHSFCWMIADMPTDGFETATKTLIKAVEFIPQRDLTKPLKAKNDQPSTTDSPKGTASKPRPIDWIKRAENQAALGTLGEIIALESEKQRLIDAGHPELAEKVVSESDDHTKGYDIHSYETTGEPRLIEVKAISKSSGQSEFYTSWRQQEVAAKAENYYYYLVHNPRSPKPTIEPILARDISPDFKTPIVFKITLPSR